ncbi:MAG: hypothetical protein LBC68_01930 [Prevotellaceae bacterium]|jgi:hypothetical protein|nr:hypothetical protein [Prevotellaceae bacterium]
MDNKFFTFIKPYLSFIDSGKLYRKPFYWLYVVLAAANLLFPFYVLYEAIDSRMFSMGDAKFIFAFILIWLVMLAAAWVGFQIWWDRKDKVQNTTSEGADFPATPVISHLIQTIGECVGAWVAIVGFGSSLFTWILLGSGGWYNELPLSGGFWGIIIFPVVGFLIIVFTRFVAEQIRALASIANNTKK